MKYYIDTEFLEGTQSKKRKDSKDLINGIYGILVAILIILFYKPENKIFTIFACILLTSVSIHAIYNYFNFKIITPNTIDLISIALVAEDGREYYAISKDFNLKEAWNRFEWKNIKNNGIEEEHKIYWIRENILNPIYTDLFNIEYKGKGIKYQIEGYNFTYKDFKRLINKYGKTNKEIEIEIRQFTYVNLHHPDYVFLNNNIQFYGYYADYDWVVFCWLFGKMIDLPKGFPEYCIDLKQILESKDWRYNGFDYTAKELKTFPNYPKNTNEHNALADARWNKQLHNFLNNL